MRYAISPKGVAKKPAARAIDDAGALLPGESFAVTEGGYDPAFVLAEDSVSLRAKTPEELTLEAVAVIAAGVEQDAQTALLGDARADAIFSRPCRRPRRRRSRRSSTIVFLLSVPLSRPSSGSCYRWPPSF